MVTWGKKMNSDHIWSTREGEKKEGARYRQIEDKPLVEMSFNSGTGHDRFLAILLKMKKNTTKITADPLSTLLCKWRSPQKANGRPNIYFIHARCSRADTQKYKHISRKSYASYVNGRIVKKKQIMFFEDIYLLLDTKNDFSIR